MKGIVKAGFFGLVALALAGFVPSAQADTVDFQCSGHSGFLNCTAGGGTTGNVTQSGGNWSTVSAISTYNTTGPYSSTLPLTQFALTFNTANQGLNGSIKLTSGGTVLSGVITSWALNPGTTTNTLTLNVFWNSLPSLVQGQLGSPNGLGQSTIISVILGSTDQAQSVDILITPTPEPATLTLVGTGLLGLGVFVRKILGS